jgi:Tfp pilus assembly protein PilF
LVRLKRHREALVHLKRAYQMRPETIRFGYVYAVGQFDRGEHDAALRTLDHLYKRYPANRDVLELLVGYNQQMGRESVAKKYAAQLDELGAPQ